MSAEPSFTLREEPADTEQQSGDLAAFRRMLQVSAGTFSFSFAVCDDRALRDRLIQRFSAGHPGIFVVSIPTDAESPLSFVEAQLPSPAPSAIFVCDLEASLPFGSTDQPTLRALNISREGWQRLRCPIVFWLAEYAMVLLQRHANDFYRYRSHQFQFTGSTAPLGQVIKESFPGQAMIDALPYDQKPFRIAELERRLREVGDPPPAELLPHALNWIYELARLQQHASRWKESESWHNKALVWAENGYGKESHEASIALNNLAQLLQDTNRLAEAEPLMRCGLEIDEASYGKDHPKVAIALNNLAQLLHDTNRLAEAEPLMRRALAIDEASYGKDHPDVAIDLNNLAQLLQATNRLAEAEPLMRRALEIDEASYGKDHPAVARDLNNLALLLQATNRLTEAEPLMRRAWEIDETSYGKEHPKVAIRLNNFAQLLQATNRLAEAEPLMRRALGIFAASYGPEHPSTQTVQGNLDVLLAAQGKAEEG
ncbi:MAG: tetratricopeptide repeat protein [Verrucomicrobiaceae bacterium]|nr:tetratricopeptide repeat protein [Verrucomicrobiaceae bacterium]